MKTWPHDGTLDWIFPLAERAGLPIALLASEFLPKVGEVAQKHPGLKLIIDHMAAIRGHQDGPFVKLPELVALAKHPNIAVKATGGPGVATDAYPFKSLHPVYRRLYDAFGPARMFWGTDITRMPCSWRQCVTAFTEEMPWLPAKDLELIMGKAVCDWIGWKRT
jgi:predicted TIM-barrel fold metal-dependent hydrolase